MKILFLLTVGMFCSGVFGQNIAGSGKIEKKTEKIDLLISKKWVSKKQVGINRNIDAYELRPYEEKDSFGNALVFEDSIHFRSYYFAFCGLDCFTTVNGRYKRINNTTIELFIDNIEQRGTCAAPTMYMYDKKYKNLGKFKISDTKGGGILLTRKR